MQVSDERAKEYVALIQRTLRRFHQSPMWEDLVSYATWKVCELLHRQPPERQDHAFGLVQQGALWAGYQFFDSQHCDLPFRWKVSQRGNELPFQLSWEDEVKEWDGRDWIERRVEPDFAPLLIESLWRRGLREQLAEQCSSRDLQIIDRWLSGERQADIATDLKIHRNRVQFCIQRGLNHLRRQEGRPSGYVRKDNRKRRRAGQRQEK